MLGNHLLPPSYPEEHQTLLVTTPIANRRTGGRLMLLAFALIVLFLVIAFMLLRGPNEVQPSNPPMRGGLTSGPVGAGSLGAFFRPA